MEKKPGASQNEAGICGKRIACAVAALSLLVIAGCGGRSAIDQSNAPFMRVFTPQVPEFLNGPAGALLTNSGFSARATFESYTPLAPGGVDTMEGELLGRGSWLLFAPRTSDLAKKDLQLGKFMYLWDVAAASGYVLSETLQGYAPVASTVKIAGVKAEPGAAPGEQNAVVSLNNGSAWLFRVWHGDDSKSVPARISSVTNAPGFTLKLTKFRPEVPPATLFAPPEGFGKYDNPEALADELALRRNTSRRGGRSGR